ncbi:MAG: hypothetical protein HYR56_20500 [Acidobacteria bacterium]|nr:hypothetical protein [Acidobacteriota bacterium]MBI3428290.1 hypothetical protein [Acidobacteriota bacterium]
MRRQVTMIFASFVMMVALVAGTIAQSGPTNTAAVSSGCKLNEDGSSICGDPLPPIKTKSDTSGKPAPFVANGSWWAVFLSWLGGLVTDVTP